MALDKREWGRCVTPPLGAPPPDPLPKGHSPFGIPVLVQLISAPRLVLTFRVPRPLVSFLSKKNRRNKVIYGGGAPPAGRGLPPAPVEFSPFPLTKGG